MKEEKDLSAAFIKAFANVPMGIRTDIVAVLDGQPMSWYVCWLEIDQKTEMGDRILDYLNELKII